MSRLQVLEFEAQVNVVNLHIALNVLGHTMYSSLKLSAAAYLHVACYIIVIRYL